ncbi:CsbD family protein [Sphingomonas sp. TDK1]|uniref:CsbD family protein n=1 Tax=Sphingomonas sp. TDK1 TaxID=453247 RepID=UPI0007D9D08D|nr:CsbD family protein [Sphingomonas sp. TDK1]OAN62280.1 general stress protein CsbD [Sphingomonas sp. TDK1]
MDTHRITGALKEVAGGVEEGLGKATGDRESAARGAARRAEGGIERRFGETLDQVRSAVRDHPLLALAASGSVALLVGAALIGRRSADD